jgi:Ankyrin repeats (many copies)
MVRSVTRVFVCCLFVALTADPARPAPLSSGATISFNGTEYFHRWSKEGQNEYTPHGEEDLSAWTNMVTIVVHDWARNGDQLAELANRVLGNYQARGKVLRTDSKPRTKDQEAEHFAAAILGTPKFLEAAFARMVLFENRGVVIVYSKRFYGAGVGDQMSAWVRRNGETVEKALMSWKGLPSLAALKALPQGGPAAQPAPTVPPASAATPSALPEPKGTGPALSRQQVFAQLKARGYPNPGDADQFVGAALQGEEELVQLFLAAGMPVDAPNRLGDRALLMAIRGGYIAMAANLLKAGADPKLGDQSGLTPLIELSEYCDETALFAAFIRKGADVNAKTRGGQTALKGATSRGCTEMVRMLKVAGAVH